MIDSETSMMPRTAPAAARVVVVARACATTALPPFRPGVAGRAFGATER